MFLNRLLAPFFNASALWKLAQLELKVRYKRSAFGVMWYLFAFGLKVAVLGGVYSHVLGKEPAEYIPFLVLGVSMWSFISSSMQYGCSSLMNSGKYAYFDPDRIFIIIGKGVVREFILGALLLVWSILGVAISKQVGLGDILQSLIGFSLCLTLVYLASSVLAFLCLVKSDISHLFSSMMNVFFIATPILWDFSDVPQVQNIMIYNPFFYMVEVVRYPLLGRELSWGFYLFFMIFIPVLLLVLFIIYKRVYGNLGKYI